MISNSEDFVWYIPLKRVVDGISNGTTVRQVTYDTGVYVTRIESISSGSINIMRLGNVDYSLHLEGYRLNKGDILFSHINSLEKVGNTAIYKGEVPLYNGMNLLRIQPSNSTNSLWLYYVLRSHYFNSQVKKIANHAINQVSISTTNLKQLVIPYVKRKFQDKIAIFLEQKTSEIDTLIEDKEKLIALLEEKRQAIITEAVTKGLDPDVKMKDSGVEWIGEIPEHWEMKKIKHVVSIQNGREILKEVDEESTDYQKYRVYGSGGFFKWTNDYLYNGESVLFGRKGTLGKPLYVNGPFWTVDTMYYSKMKKVKAKYFYFVLLSFPWEIITTQTALPSIVSTDLSNENWCFPSIKEQNAIINYLDKVDGETTSNVKLLKRQIELLKEYRQALIYEAVTGKIDVQEMLKETEQEEVSSS